MNWGYYPYTFSETRTYNPRLQLTRLTATGVDLEYRYSATQNNGQITQMKDWATGEEVSYGYDALSRLSSAVTTGPEWGQSYSYDGFGNRVSVTVIKGTAPGGSLIIDPANNHITSSGFSYDGNGNLTSMPALVLSYDYDNRLTCAGTECYGYDAENRRVLKAASSQWGWGTAEVYFYGVEGRKLGTYQLNWGNLNFQTLSENLYFGGRVIKAQGKWVVTDRLGSVVKSESEVLRYFPWGEERSTTTQNREKFATYHRDSTGLDYADQRYYSSFHGWFLTPDPAEPGDPANPPGFNLYAYVLNDPVNFNDPGGLVPCGDLVILGTNTTLRDAMTVSTRNPNLSLLASVVWAESDHTWSRQGSQAYFDEQDAIAWSVLNRWRILNGYLSVSGVSDPGSLGWGPYGASMGQILGQPGQYSTFAGGPSNPHLRGDLQSDLDDLLDEKPTADDHIDIQVGNTVTSMSHNCYNVWQSWVTASFALSGSSTDPFARRGYTTSFHHGLMTTHAEPWFGSFGTANNFFGIPNDAVTVNATPPQPLIRTPPQRPPGRSR
jgi:RHS repeat-associated protein